MALYLYGIMRADDVRAAASAVRESDAAEADAIDHGRLGALISRVPDTELRMRRESILAHANVLQAAFRHGPVLPMRLGTVLPDEETVVREVLTPRADLLAMQLDELDGRAEMQVKATYAEEPLLRSILARDPALRRAVERSRALPAAATHFEQIRIGEAIAQAVQLQREGDTQAFLDALRPLAVSVSVSAPHHERAVLNAAFLIDSGHLSRFDAAVEDLSADHSDRIEFKLIGPLPAYSFVQADWQALGLTGTPA